MYSGHHTKNPLHSFRNTGLQCAALIKKQGNMLSELNKRHAIRTHRTQPSKGISNTPAGGVQPLPLDHLIPTESPSGFILWLGCIHWVVKNTEQRPFLIHADRVYTIYTVFNFLLCTPSWAWVTPSTTLEVPLDLGLKPQSKKAASMCCTLLTMLLNLSILGVPYPIPIPALIRGQV